MNDMNYKDYYKIMGLSSDASEKDIKAAYRRLARQYHPDLNKTPNAEEKFKAMAEAYEVLKDPEKRKTYDQYRQNFQAHQNARYHQGSEQPGFRQAGSSQQGFHFNADFFESLFGHPPFQDSPVAGADYQSHLTISLEEAYRGEVKTLQMPIGASNQPKTIRVKIPAGVQSGQKIRLSGQGGPSRGSGPTGDLYLTIHVAPHPVFDVKDHDVYLTLPVAPWEAALGASLKVPTLGGEVTLKIPPGAQGGQTLRLKQRGLPGKKPGDQYVILKIMIPQPTTDAARELYKQMAKEMPFDPREALRGQHD